MPYFPDAESLGKAEPRIYYPDGPRFSVSGRTVSWMGWNFHADIHGLNGLHISNLRFRDEMMVYEMHATEFSAVYSGVSSKKDVFYSDGGYEMGVSLHAHTLSFDRHPHPPTYTHTTPTPTLIYTQPPPPHPLELRHHA